MTLEEQKYMVLKFNLLQ